MILVDTSVWIDVLRDKSGSTAARFETQAADEDIALSRFTQLELLQGAKDETEWSLLTEYLDGQEYLDAHPETWPAAARIYYDLRRRGKTVRSPIDCCIAQLAIDHGALLLHIDRDFETIADLRPLRQARFI